jgi:hypothetical protein
MSQFLKDRIIATVCPNFCWVNHGTCHRMLRADTKGVFLSSMCCKFCIKTPARADRHLCRRLTKGRQRLVLPSLIDGPTQHRCTLEGGTRSPMAAAPATQMALGIHPSPEFLSNPKSHLDRGSDGARFGRCIWHGGGSGGVTVP